VLSAWDEQRAALQALFVYIYIHISIRLYTYIYWYICTHIFMCIYNYTLLCCLLQGENKGCSFHGAQRMGRTASGIASAYIYTYTYIYIYTHTYMYIHISIYIYLCIYLYWFIYTRIHIYIYTYITIVFPSVCHRGKTKAALFTVLSAWDEQRAALQALYIYLSICNYLHIWYM